MKKTDRLVINVTEIIDQCDFSFDLKFIYVYIYIYIYI